MTAPSLRQLLADVLHKERRFDEIIGPEPEFKDYHTADALLASPLADIIDLAAEMELTFGATASLANFPPEVRALLADWREGRS